MNREKNKKESEESEKNGRKRQVKSGERERKRVR